MFFKYVFEMWFFGLDISLWKRPVMNAYFCVKNGI